MIKQVFGSFFRTIGRIIAYLLFGALLGLIFQNSDVFAAESGYNNSTYNTYYYDCYLNLQGQCNATIDRTSLTTTGFVNEDTSNGLKYGSGNYNSYIGRWQMRVFSGSSYTYNAGNSYTFRFTFNFENTSSDFLNILKNYYTVSDIYGNTTSSITNSSMEYVDTYSYRWEQGSVPGRYLLYLTFTPNTNIKYVGFFITFKSFIPWFNDTLKGSTNNMLYGPFTFTYLKITYEEGSNALIENQTNVIQQQTDKINQSIENLLQVFQQDSDKMEDIYLDDTENEDGTCNGIICNLKKVVRSVINLPVTLINSIIDALKSLFIPADFDFINDFRDSIESKLGFIAEIPSAMIEFLFAIAASDWDEMDSIQFPEIEIFGYKFWNSQTIDLTEAINIFKPFKYVTDILCVIICINTMAKWRDKFTGGGS